MRTHLHVLWWRLHVLRWRLHVLRWWLHVLRWWLHGRLVVVVVHRWLLM
jgi:hypothetical protein